MSESEPAPPEDVDSLVEQINQVDRRHGLDAALAIGRLVLRGLADGERDRAQGGRLQALESLPSYRCLAEHPRLSVSHARLWQAVQVTLQHPQLPERARDALSFTHHRALLSAPDDSTRTKLAQRAAEEGWTSRELQEQVGRTRARRSRGGRKRKATGLRALASIRRARDWLSEDEAALFRGLNQGEAAELLVDLRAGVGELEERVRRIGSRRGGRHG